MKKLSIALIICLFTVFFATSVSAARSLCTPDKTNLSPGDEVTFTVSLSESAALRTMGITPVYDKNVFELISAKWTVKGASLSDFNEITGDGVLLFTNDTECTGEIFTFTLKVKTTANVSETTVKAKMTLKNQNDETIECEPLETKVFFPVETAPESTATTPVETTPIETPSAETLPIESIPSESTPVESIPSESQAAESTAPAASTEVLIIPTVTSAPEFTTDSPADETVELPEDIPEKSSQTLLWAVVGCALCFAAGIGFASSKKKK